MTLGRSTSRTRGEPYWRDTQGRRVREHPHGVNMVQGVCSEEQKSPSAADQRVAENAIALAPLEKDPARQEGDRNNKGKANLPERTQLAEFINAKKGDSQHKDGDSKLVEPIRAQCLFQSEHRLHALLSRWLWR